MSLIFLNWLPRCLGMHRPGSNNSMPDPSRNLIGTLKERRNNIQMGQSNKANGASFILSQHLKYEPKEPEPKLMLQTLLDWEQDYAPPPHICNQKPPKSFESVGPVHICPQKTDTDLELTENNMERSKSSDRDMMRGLSNILKVVARTFEYLSNGLFLLSYY